MSTMILKKLEKSTAIKSKKNFLAQRIGRIAGEQAFLNGWEKICRARSGSNIQELEKISSTYIGRRCVLDRRPKGSRPY